MRPSVVAGAVVALGVAAFAAFGLRPGHSVPPPNHLTVNLSGQILQLPHGFDVATQSSHGMSSAAGDAHLHVAIHNPAPPIPSGAQRVDEGRSIYYVTRDGSTLHLYVYVVAPGHVREAIVATANGVSEGALLGLVHGGIGPSDSGGRA